MADGDSTTAGLLSGGGGAHDFGLKQMLSKRRCSVVAELPPTSMANQNVCTLCSSAPQLSAVVFAPYDHAPSASGGSWPSASGAIGAQKLCQPEPFVTAFAEKTALWPAASAMSRYGRTVVPAAMKPSSMTFTSKQSCPH